MKAANTDSEFREICSAESAPFIRSASDWKTYWTSLKTKKDSWQSKISNAAFKEWEDSAEYKNGGLAHASYELLEKELSEEELNEFFRLFGIDNLLAEDHKGHRCESRGTCTKSTAKICTSNCLSPSISA